MKKLIVKVAVVAGLLFAGTANAQLAVNVGYAPENFVRGDNTTQMNGFFAGVNYNLNLSGDINLSVGAQYRHNSRTTEDDATLLGVTATGKATHTQSLVDVPVLLNYTFALSSALKLTFFAGPTFSYALSGNTHTVNSVSGWWGGGSSSNDLDWYGENSKRERLNVSGTVGGVITYNRIRFFAGYNYGLLDLDKRDDATLKTNGLFAGLGFVL